MFQNIGLNKERTRQKECLRGALTEFQATWDVRDKLKKLGKITC